MLEDDLHWYHLALCHNMPLNHFYDQYESDPVVAEVMDDICLSCPVRKMCLREGVENGEWGLWGGVYLENGKTNEAKNAHKTEETWNKIRKNIG